MQLIPNLKIENFDILGEKMIKVLIVEDEEKIARFIELELKHEGYEVDKALDGRTGS